MFKEYKYSVWAMSLKLLMVYLGSVIINLLISFGLLLMFKDSLLWQWCVQIIALIVLYGPVFISISSEGKRDILADSANEKRFQRDAEFKYDSRYDERKGFIAGLFAQIPIILIFVVWSAIGENQGGSELIARMIFSHYFQLINSLGFNIFSVIFFAVGFIVFTGLTYLSAKSYRIKILTIIKRKEENAKNKK